MRKIIEKRNYIILFVIIILLFWIFSNKGNSTVKSFDINDKVLTVIIYEKVDKMVLEKIGEICDKWDGKQSDSYIYSNSYAALDIIRYFNKKGIEKYLINEDGNVSVGKRYGEDKYSVSILNPRDGEILKILSLENESVATVKDDSNSVSVIYGDNVKALEIGNRLFSLGVDEGMKVCEELKCEAFWYADGHVYETDKLKN